MELLCLYYIVVSQQRGRADNNVFLSCVFVCACVLVFIILAKYLMNQFY